MFLRTPDKEVLFLPGDDLLCCFTEHVVFSAPKILWVNYLHANSSWAKMTHSNFKMLYIVSELTFHYVSESKTLVMNLISFASIPSYTLNSWWGMQKFCEPCNWWVVSKKWTLKIGSPAGISMKIVVFLLLSAVKLPLSLNFERREPSLWKFYAQEVLKMGRPIWKEGRTE